MMKHHELSLGRKQKTVDQYSHFHIPTATQPNPLKDINKKKREKAELRKTFQPKN